MSSFSQDSRPSIYESNPQIALLVDNIGATELGDVAAMQYRAFVDQVLNLVAKQLTGHASRGVPLDAGQVNAALQLLQQARYKLHDAIALGGKEQQK